MDIISERDIDNIKDCVINSIDLKKLILEEMDKKISYDFTKEEMIYDLIEITDINENRKIDSIVTVSIKNDTYKMKISFSINNLKICNINIYEVEDLIEEIVKAEKLSFDIDYWSYNITYDQIKKMYERDKFIIPDMQRGFVWDHIQSSKLIESIFMGLPLPSLFLMKQENSKFVIVDGLQRITTISHFSMNKALPNMKEGQPFKLKGVNNQINGCTYQDLQEKHPNLIDRFEMATINVIEFKQNTPEFEEAMYFLFERLNSGGTSLSEQQIRNSISYGYFNKKLNKYSKDILSDHFSKKQNDNLKPAELILRVISIYDYICGNNIMNKHKNEELTTTSVVYKTLLNKTAEKYHLDYKKIERQCIRENKEFNISEEYDNYIKKIDLIFENINICFKKVKDIFGSDMYKRVELNSDTNKIEFTGRISPILVEAILVTLLLEKHKLNEMSSKESILNKYKEILEDSYDDYFKQSTGQPSNIVGRINTIKEIFW